MPEQTQKFGRLTLIELLEPDGKCKSRKARFLCDCGTEKVALWGNVKSGKTRSCGCLHNEVRRKPKTHGLTGTREYSSWSSMMQRCYNSKAKRYELYGGRGIIVCERWHDAVLFVADMGPRPKGFTLDRIDPNGNYELENCRWADIHTQNRHLRKRVGCASEFKGVERHHSGKWSARIRVDNKSVWLGNYDSEAEAGAAYLGACIIRDLEAAQ